MRIVMNNQENDSQTPNNSSDSVQEAAISVGVGAAVGAGASTVVGGMGLAVILSLSQLVFNY